MIVSVMYFRCREVRSANVILKQSNYRLKVGELDVDQAYFQVLTKDEFR